VQKKWPAEVPLANVSSADFDLIEGLRPYQGVDLSRDTDGAIRKPLVALTQVNSADKHAALHGAVACLVPHVEQRLLSIQPEIPV
jgi:hypothetical protein